MSQYPWYDHISGNEQLQQGDFIKDCQVVIPPQGLVSGQSVDIVIEQMDVIILTQSCDLANNKIEFVLVCPYFDLEEFISMVPVERRNTLKARKKLVNDMKSGVMPAFHLLKNDDGPFAYVVDFRNVYGVHKQVLETLSTKPVMRRRLLPPYREHLSQSFARYFMRVGLPQDIEVEVR